jgi:hypothetical protein
MELARLQVLADQETIPRLLNDIVWQLFELYRKGTMPPLSVVDFAFNNITKSSEFRRLLVSWYTWPPPAALVHETPTPDELEKVPRFACEWAARMANKPSRNPFRDGPAEYYVDLQEEQPDKPADELDDEWDRSAKDDHSIRSD